MVGMLKAKVIMHDACIMLYVLNKMECTMHAWCITCRTCDITFDNNVPVYNILYDDL